MAIKFDIKNLPSYVKAIIAFLPSVIITVLVIILVVTPKQKEIKKLEAQIDQQNNKIAESQTKAARLDVLKKENERLLNRLNELKEQLPEEKEISSLLKQVSDNSIGAGLEVKSWKPSQKKTHSSGIVYEIPVSVSVIGTYHNLGYFLSSLTKLNRIVNVNDMKLGGGKKGKDISSVLDVSFTASTFSAVPEEEMAKAAEVKGKPGKAPPGKEKAGKEQPGKK